MTAIGSLLLDDDLRLLARTARDLLDQRAPASRLRDLPTGGGHDRDLWGALAELGLLGPHLPERHGGLDLGLFDLCVVLEALGRNLAPEPVLTTTLLAAEALVHGAPDAADRWLPRVISGDALLAVAWEEPRARGDFRHVATTADAAGRLTGTKVQVIAGRTADRLVVTARDADGRLGAWLVDPTAAGLTFTDLDRVDRHAAAHLTLDATPTEARLDLDEAALASLFDRATVGLCAEMLGGATAAFELTTDYLKERHQFGVPIGSFQALQHRAARLFLELELTRSAVLGAARAADDAPAELPRLASAAKARATETYLLVANEAIQLHGGVGMTEEHDIGLYLKRARACAVTFGDAAFHRARWATLSGYGS